MNYFVHIEHTDLEDLSEDWEQRITLFIGGVPYEPYVEYDEEANDPLYFELYDRSPATPYSVASAKSLGWKGGFYDETYHMAQKKPVHTISGYYDENIQEFDTLKEALIAVLEVETKLEVVEKKFLAAQKKYLAKEAKA